MGSCTRRHFMLSICFMQMITIIERQVFDFLGYMWLPIIVNFFHIIFVIFGFYGAYHFRVRYIITYLVWSFLWVGWNSFLICFYLNVGILNKDSDLLNLGTGSVSWFEVNGLGCKPTYPTNITSDDPYRPIRPERVDDCLLDYTIVEILHSGVQCALALLGIIGAILIGYLFLEEDDRLKYANKTSKHRQSMYSIEFGPSVETIRSRAGAIIDYDENLNEHGGGGELSPKPMTPRRVKRRSVMARGSSGRHSSKNRQSHGRDDGTHSRSSVRNSRRKYHQNPVTKLIDQQQQQKQKQQHYHLNSKQQFGSFHHKDNPSLTVSNLQTLNQETLSNTGSLKNNILITSGSSLTKSNNSHQQSFRKNIPPDPIYYNTNGQDGLYRQTISQSIVMASDEPPTLTSSATLESSCGGHYNASYQHSVTNLNDTELHADDTYNNRPPSVRSSYSNFHGTRPVSSYLPTTTTTENVFMGLTNVAVQSQQPTQSYIPSTPPLYQQHSSIQASQKPNATQSTGQLFSNYSTSTMPQNIPYPKRSASRESIRSMAFLNSGPPAYNLNYHTPPDSETTM